MRPLPPTELLQRWEAGQTQPRWAWAASLIAAAFPAVGHDRIAELTIGERDRRLLEVRETLFGSELACRSVCPVCSERLEMTVSTSALLARGGEPPRAGFVDVQTAVGELRVRPPTARDLAEAADGADVLLLRERLLQRCIAQSDSVDHSGGSPELSATDTTLVIDAIAAADPDADIRLALTCPACGKNWSEVFDIVEFLWTEIDDWAGRQLREVHALASAYGWTEAEVLAVSPQRRAHYLEMIRA